MTAAIDAAGSRFRTALRPAWDLIDIHKRLSESPGRRETELSLNRGAVVFAVAAWQTFVEQLTIAMVDAATPAATAAAADKHLFSMLKANIDNQVKRLNVPNARKTLELWAWLGFDPTRVWATTYSWQKQRSVYHGGWFNDSATVTMLQAQDDLDTYVLIRHKIVHGDLIPSEPRFARLATGQRDGRPRLKRVDADRCLNFIQSLVTATTAESNRRFP